MNPLRDLVYLGQAVWYDNLSRELLRSGELRRMIEIDGVTGVTSNPSILEKALREERIYDNDVHNLVDTGLGIAQIYEELVIPDIQEAADTLLPVYEETRGRDGFVSLEVSPELAYDTEQTIAEAKRLFSRVDRKNLMIKVPATAEGLDAVIELIAEGINVNITLIFSLDQYRDTIDAYLRGLEKLAETGRDLGNVASVASFFVSRVDTVVDEQLKDRTDPSHRSVGLSMLGKAAIANAKLAYSIFKETFESELFEDLKAQGAQPQRIVWASTSTKNPDYPDTYYVDALIGPHTVNTIPPATLQAFRDHGRPSLSLDGGVEDARSLFRSLKSMGIHVPDLLDKLLQDGLRAFAGSYLKIMKDIETKRTRLLRGWGHRSASLGELQQDVDALFKQFDDKNVGESIWSTDTSVWTADPKVGSAIAQRLGWLHVINRMQEEQPKIKEFALEIKESGIESVVLLGMGGSSLVSEVFSSCFGVIDDYPVLKIIDTTVPGAILDMERSLDLKKTMFIVASKSGTTVEVMSLYKHFRKQMEAAVGDQAGDHFIAITDPNTHLGKLAAQGKFRRTFLNPPDIGGRFSALSYFGLVPAALMGINLKRLLMRADQSAEACGPEVSSLENPGTWLGTIISEAALHGFDKLTLVISPGLETFANWLEQLVAESTGKEGKGVLPIAGEEVGLPNSYGDDRVFIYIRLDGDDTYDQAMSDLEQAGHRVVTQRMHNAYDLGREMFRWEFATAISGIILKINPFDQPNVQQSKDITKKYLETFIKDGRMPAGDFLTLDDPNISENLRNFFESVRRRDYVGLNVFMRANGENKDLLEQMRSNIRDRFQVATTVGFGPRYLHSTGQIHKGGPDTGIFLLITCEDSEDIPIPGEKYSFGVLKTAQALGDYEALKQTGRRIRRIHLTSEAELSRLAEAIKTI
ncbi:bifunctional transaldolase/phosoglucose isomerase [Desulfomonile tiedjei]|uniref:Transaldolase n=1 Tax=Desulfomonile tiedjei (strain ATCC 49306 / DSM 6799 / DCB-1) TaxID=706587 RepID=I4CC00_DESTA|nr:bifunctional transaldolase/phosoglucose isomerase [Desulfomonile tiedjei]AFM27091.1 transaldolase [Desulfomonile tiedjei DSM 6799]